MNSVLQDVRREMSPTQPVGVAESPWHVLPANAVLDRLESAPEGLSQREAARRLENYGLNELQAHRPVSPWMILLAQLRNVLIVILLVATVLSAFLGHAVEAVAIAVIVLFAVILGFVQEFRAERAIEALRRLAAPSATVLRDGSEAEVPARELVPGDVVLLRAGDKIPADLRLIEAVNLQVEEAPLTGESVAVEKHIAPLADSQVPLGDRRNIGYAGTTATYGRGRGVVVATGMHTEFGRIAQMLQTVETGKTPLQANVDHVARLLGRAAIVVVLLIVVLGLIRGQPLIEMFILGIALAVAVVPEALPAVVTISLAIGVQRLVRRNALMRRLPAVETLGSTSVICSDKTGTLTKDEMTVRQVLVAGQRLEVSGAGYEPVGEFFDDNRRVQSRVAGVESSSPQLVGSSSSIGLPSDIGWGLEDSTPATPLQRLLQAAVLACDAHVVRNESDGRWRVKGDPTEGALVVVAAKAGLHKADLDAQFPRVDEIPFTSESKRMTTLHAGPDGTFACAKGAPEVIVGACRRVLTADGEVPLDGPRREQILETARQMAADALRVLAVAWKSPAQRKDAERDMTFLGLAGMIDPPRPEAKGAVRTCAEAGIKPVMITGDHPLTARAVARELGLLREKGVGSLLCEAPEGPWRQKTPDPFFGRVVTGADLDAMTDAELEAAVDAIDVYARVSPAHKLRVVTALQRRGEIVAMTGDGVNDAPALKKADIGIAMGITGTDVTREAAAMTLTDDNFASIVAAVEEGRGIFGNIKKYLMYLLSSNIGEIGLMAGALLLGLPLPLSAVQILYVNLATDGLPALALAVDPPEPDLMRRPPRNPRTRIFTRPVVTLMTVGGVWSAAVNLGLFAWALHSGRSLAEAMTMTFVSLVLIQFIKAYNFRSDRNSVLLRPFANKWLNLAIVWELLLLVLIVYLPFLHRPFGTFSLPLVDWLIVLALSASVSPVLELTKWLERRGWFGKLI